MVSPFHETFFMDPTQYSSFSARVNTKFFSGFYTTDDHSIEDLSMFPEIIAQMVNMFPQIEIRLGDALYSNRRMCSITEKYGITRYILSEKNPTFHAIGAKSWKMMIYGSM